jgi:hypothetical protein
MENIIEYCGIICSDCPVLLATQKIDNMERRCVAEVLTKQHGEEFKPEDTAMAAPATASALLPYCGACGIRKSGIDKEVKNCAYCSEYPCE